MGHRGRPAISPEIILQISNMIEEYSYSEIAARLHLHVASVKSNVKKYNITRSKEATAGIRSRIRKNMIKSERRRALFGFDQHTNLKVFTNPERMRLKLYLKRYNYIIRSRGSMVVYYNENTKRVRDYEERGRKVGLKFEQLIS